MKAATIFLFFISCFLLAFSGGTNGGKRFTGNDDTIRVKRNIDTLKLLQGEWDFGYVMLADDQNKKNRSYLATEMEVDSGFFIMRLSEAAENGQVKRKNNRFVFEFGNLCWEDPYSENLNVWCSDMEIARIDKRNLHLLRRNMPRSGYINGTTGNGDVILVYRKSSQTIHPGG
jgi:hypothetical protein